MICPRNQHQQHWIKTPALVPAAKPGVRTILEVGPGRGEFLLHLAEQHPEAHIIAIELCTGRFMKLRRRTAHTEHVSLIYGDARLALRDMALREQIDELYINFPDPWPKRRHAPNRLMQESFIDCCAHALKPGAELIFTTDWPDYAEETAQRLQKHTQFESCFADAMQVDTAGVFPTYFYEKWIAIGRSIHHLRYRKL